MFRPADRLSQVRPSVTKAMTARARSLRQQGRDIITLSQGEPDFDTPTHIADAGVEAIRKGHTRYTQVPGILPLREAICEKLRDDNGLNYDPDDIIVGCGAKQVLFNALFASLNPGDEVIIAAPCWVSYPDLVRLCGGTPRIVETTAEADFKLAPQMLEDAITPKTRWLLLNSPSNPTGAVYSSQELTELGEVLRRFPDVWILCDDIYEKLIYGPAEFATLAQVCPDLSDRILVVNGVSKSAAMTGWRVGYGAGPKGLIKSMTKMQGQTTSHTSSISQYAAITALQGDGDFQEEFRQAFEKRRDFLVDKLFEIKGLRGFMPQGAFYLFVPVGSFLGKADPTGRTIETDVDLAMHLLEDHGVSLVPGTGFLAPGHLRVSYAENKAVLEEAASRIIQAFSNLR